MRATSIRHESAQTRKSLLPEAATGRSAFGTSKRAPLRFCKNPHKPQYEKSRSIEMVPCLRRAATMEKSESGTQGTRPFFMPLLLERAAQFAAWRSILKELFSLPAVSMGKFDSGTQTTGPRLERVRAMARLSSELSLALTASSFSRLAKTRRQDCGMFPQARKWVRHLCTKARYGP